MHVNKKQEGGNCENQLSNIAFTDLEKYYRRFD
jgi:hypothetical protein